MAKGTVVRPHMHMPKHYFGICYSPMDSEAKIVDINMQYKLDIGTHITVKFLETNTVANPTLNVNNTGAKRIMYRNYPIQPEALSSGSIYTLVYTGDCYEIVGPVFATF